MSADLSGTPSRPFPDGEPVLSRDLELVVSCGDPQGIGPEVSLKAARRIVEEAPRVRVVLAAPEGRLLQLGARSDELQPPDAQGAIALLPVPDLETRDPPPSRAGGKIALASLRVALERVRAEPHRRALVTAPLAKAAVALDLPGFSGHTGWLADTLGVGRALMLFVADGLRVALATVHVPLERVPEALTVAGLEAVLLQLDAGLTEVLGIDRPRVAVLGLNPHAGEGGLLGTEEETVIRPAIARALRRGMEVSGPFPADSFFGRRLFSGYDAVLAMYHDQGLLPVKTLAPDRAVNVTIGLPILRTSPDHGCAFDIAGRDIASPDSMHAALAFASARLLARIPPL